MLILLFTLVWGTEEEPDCNSFTQGSTLWWTCCYPLNEDPPASCPAGGTKTSFCDQDKNDKYHIFPVNEDCNNAGTCVDHNWMQAGLNPPFTWGVCECANPADENNFVWKEDENGDVHGDAWDFQLFLGDDCKTVEFKLYGTISYLIKVDEWDSSDPDLRQGRAGVFECNTGGAGGAGIAFNEANPLEELPENDPGNWRTIPDMAPLVRAVIQFNEYWSGADEGLRIDNYYNYDGIVVPWKDSQVNNQHCRVCSNANICTVDGTNYGDITTNGKPGGYLKVSFATNYNTYYNHTCEKANGIMPTDIDGYTRDPLCPDNDDDGFSALNAFEVATSGDDDGKHHREHFLELTKQSSTTKVFEYVHEDDGHETIVYGMNWDEKLQITRTNSGLFFVKGTSTNSLRFPTLSPTMDPTTLPTPPPTPNEDTCFDLGYTHQVADMKFMGMAQSGNRGCRWGLHVDWPGGDTDMMCDSPYVVCLPEANTPNVGTWSSKGYIPYPASDALYTIEMCKKECAYDQRCNGFEFWVSGEADGAFTGKCSLIDDIPIVPTDTGGSSFDGSITTESGLLSQQWTSLAPAAICYHKDHECNPYFGEDDLDAVMLECYCPNNRKGFYTKNVVRTVKATEFCGSDTDGSITKRIREAQANRMFHLCENWCLFNTQHPREESWYHDPWMECWREQYAGVGTHRSYCYRVIRDPFTIEQYFIDQRSQNMCKASDASKGFGNNVNTPAPVVSGVVTDDWFLAAEEDSCDDRCASEGLLCNNDDIMTVLNGNEGRIAGYMAAAGYTCTSYAESDTVSPNGSHGWATPAKGPGGECIMRHPDANTPNMMAGCNVAIGVGYQRLCACGDIP